jgi:hypothetical protein
MSKHQTPITKAKGVQVRTAPRRPPTVSHVGQKGVGVRTSNAYDRAHTKLGKMVAHAGVFNGLPPAGNLPGVFAPVDKTALTDAELAAYANSFDH